MCECGLCDGSALRLSVYWRSKRTTLLSSELMRPLGFARHHALCEPQRRCIRLLTFPKVWVCSILCFECTQLSSSFVATEGAGREVGGLQVCNIAPCEYRPAAPAGAATVDLDNIQCAVCVPRRARFAGCLPACVSGCIR